MWKGRQLVAPLEDAPETSDLSKLHTYGRMRRLYAPGLRGVEV